MLCSIVQGLFAQPPRLQRVESGKVVGMNVDSLYLRADSLRRDSIRMAKVMADSMRLDSVQYAKYVKDSIRKSSKFILTRDTITPGAHLALSLVPGMGQIYNQQYWKAPVLVGAMGGFIAGGVIMGQKYSKTQLEWQDAVNLDPDSDLSASLQDKMYGQKSAKTIFYTMAGATYLYSIADATFNYRGNMNHISKATKLAVLFPGAGFFYTRTYWRIPIYYGGFAVMMSVVSYNNRYYQRFKTAYNLVMDDDPDTVDEFNGRFSSEVLSNARDTYRRNRDFGIICTAAVYLLSIIDTYVVATLKNWDVSPDLANISVEPTLFNNTVGKPATELPNSAGLTMKIKF